MNQHDLENWQNIKGFGANFIKKTYFYTKKIRFSENL